MLLNVQSSDHELWHRRKDRSSFRHVWQLGDNFNFLSTTIIMTIQLLGWDGSDYGPILHNRTPNSCSSCSSQKSHVQWISETESGIIDPLVSKRPEKSQRKKKENNPISRNSSRIPNYCLSSSARPCHKNREWYHRSAGVKTSMLYF